MHSSPFSRRCVLPVLPWALLGLAACTGTGTEPKTDPERASHQPRDAEQKLAEQKPEQLTVYCGRGEPLAAPALEAFERATGVDLQIRYADTAQLAAAILEEGARSPADVFIAQDASTLGFLEGKGALAPLEASVLAAVPASSKSASGRWIGLSGRARVLAYNTHKLKPEELPKSLDELTAPAWKGRVGWAPENASFQAFVAAMIELRGRDATKAWLTAMEANAPKAYPKNTPAVVAVSTGEVDVALVNHYYLHRLRQEKGEGFPVENHYFKSGDAASLVNLSGGAVLAASKKPALAGRLLAYLVSPEGQKHFTEGNHELPVTTGVAMPEGLPSVEGVRAPALDPGKLDNLEATVALLRETKVLR